MHTPIIAKNSVLLEVIDRVCDFRYTNRVPYETEGNFVNGIDRLEAIYDAHAADPVLGMYGLSLLGPLFLVAREGEFPLLPAEDFDHFITATSVFWFQRKPVRTVQFVPMSDLQYFCWEYNNEPFEYGHPLAQAIAEEVEFVLSKPLGNALHKTMDRWIGDTISVDRRLHLFMGMWNQLHSAIMSLVFHSLGGETEQVEYVAPYIGILHHALPVLAEERCGVKCLIITRGEESE